ncbi:MAG: hypothetical protein OXT63_06230 [Gemmatimonadota bacterium]|nr:hypothetical protein [Gemmatimonadota bacterium]
MGEKMLVFKVRMEPQLKAFLEEQAEAQEMKLSEFLRKAGATAGVLGTVRFDRAMQVAATLGEERQQIDEEREEMRATRDRYVSILTDSTAALYRTDAIARSLFCCLASLLGLTNEDLEGLSAAYGERVDVALDAASENDGNRAAENRALAEIGGDFAARVASRFGKMGADTVMARENAAVEDREVPWS